MLTKLLLSGGCLRPRGFELGEGKYYDTARLIELDLTTGDFSLKLEQSQGGENYPDTHPNLQFTVGAIDGELLWLPTDTEIHCYHLPTFKKLKTISHPCFHNIHSVHMFDGSLYVTSTGIDNVIVINPETGGINNVINCDGKAPWHRFNPNVDYRKVHSTRPHDCHPNYLFKLEEHIWVTRCTQEDAVNLDDVSDRIDIDLGGDKGVHDGVWYKDKLVFTQVDGRLLICNPESRKMEQIYDPFEKTKNRPLGWCRGLHIDGNDFYIGFSKLRKTNVKSRLKFLSQGNFKFAAGNNALVVKLNMKTQTVERIFETPDGLIDAIYGVMPSYA